MKKVLPIFLIGVSVVLGLLYSQNVLAQYKLPKGSHSVTVSARLGDFYLNLSGYIAPFASIVLYSDGIYLRATTADQFGYFTISEVLIKQGFSKFCFDAVDFKRLGESYSCMKIPPAKGNVTIKDIFLPPTLGLSRTTIAAGSSAVAFGYSMPNALVTLHFGDKTYTTYADSTGYYQFVVKDVKAGVYKLYSTATLNEKPSLEPEKKLTLKSLSWWEQILEWLKNLLNKIWQFMTSLSFGPLWLAIPIIILIIILIL
ncbi:MAG: hypothetical protein UR81_C0005G0010, partial [Candidatus Levybacteria bacterium GW2011_GWB1_35_5]